MLKRGEKKDFFDILKDELLENYVQIIRDAREAKGWSQEDLAENIRKSNSDQKDRTQRNGA